MPVGMALRATPNRSDFQRREPPGRLPNVTLADQDAGGLFEAADAPLVVFPSIFQQLDFIVMGSQQIVPEVFGDDIKVPDDLVLPGLKPLCLALHPPFERFTQKIEVAFRGWSLVVRHRKWGNKLYPSLPTVKSTFAVRRQAVLATA